MAFEAEGFLSATIEEWRNENATRNAKILSITKNINTLIQKLLMETQIEIGDGVAKKYLLAMPLLARALSNFQGAILMAERGMIVECRTLIRSCLETTYLIVALDDDAYDLPQKMLDADEYQKKTFVAGLNDSKDFRKLATREQREAVKKRSNELKESVKNNSLSREPEKIKYEELSRRGGINSTYHIYRQLSGEAAHPTISALDRYWQEEKGLMVFVVGPSNNNKEIREAVFWAASIIVGAGSGISKIYKNDTFEAELSKLFDELLREFNQ